MKKIAVLISGSGTNLKNLAEECQKSLKGKCQIAIVISNLDGVKGLEVAKEYGIKTAVLPDLTPKISVSSRNIESYNEFAKLKLQSDRAFNVINRYLVTRNYEYSLIKLLEDCLSNIAFTSKFPEEDIKDSVLTDVFYEAFTKEKVDISEDDEEEILSQIDTILYEEIEEIKVIANFFDCIKKQLSFMNLFSREKYDEILNNFLVKEEVDYIFLAGFMRILSTSFTCKWEGKIINIHPSLLPAFGGGKAVKEALEYGVRITGCTVHFVNVGVDSGKIIAQKSVEVLTNDTVETLHERIKIAEKELYPSVLNQLIEEKL